MPVPVVVSTRLPENISEGAVGGPMFNTIVTAGSTGAEVRVAMWEVCRYMWEISHSSRTPAQMMSLVSFFKARRGKRHAFLFKDLADFTATDEVLDFDGRPVIQLIKTYSDGGVDYVRELYKIVASPSPTIKKNGGLIAGAFDLTTGLVTLPAVITKSISTIALGATTVATVGSSHGFTVNDEVFFKGIFGPWQLNGAVGTVTAIASTTITVSIDSSTYDAYISGGSAIKYGTTTDVFTWSGEFDVPVRFDVDQMRYQQENVGCRNWENVPIAEVIGDSELEDVIAAIVAAAGGDIEEN